MVSDKIWSNKIKCFYLEWYVKQKKSVSELRRQDNSIITVRVCFNLVQKQKSRNGHYENTPIQIYRKFHLQKLKIFR